MQPFQELVDHAKRKNLNSITSKPTITESYIRRRVDTICLYFLNEMNKGVDYFDLLQVFSSDTNKNEAFIERYFKKLEKLE